MKVKAIEDLLEYHRGEVKDLVNKMNEYETAIYASVDRADKTTLVSIRKEVGDRLTRQVKAVAHYEEMLQKRKK